MQSFCKNHALVALGWLIMLSGCSGGGSQISPTALGLASGSGAEITQRQVVQDRINSILALHTGIAVGHTVTTPSFMSPGAAVKPLVFVSDQFDNAVDIYPQAGQNQKMIGQITGLNLPSGLATDAARNLYIANEGADEVLVYAPPYTGAPQLTLPAGPNTLDVAVSKRRVVAEMTFCGSVSCSGSGFVSFYAKNSTTACATVADPVNFQYLWSGGFDGKGSLYILGTGGSFADTVVGRIDGGCNAKNIRLLTTTNTLSSYASGIHIGHAGRIGIIDGVPSNPVIYSYNRSQSDSLGAPVSTSPLTGLSAYSGYFAFRRAGRSLYAPNFGSSSLPGVVYEYGYIGGAPRDTITLGGTHPAGVAVAPPLVP